MGKRSLLVVAVMALCAQITQAEALNPNAPAANPARAAFDSTFRLSQAPDQVLVNGAGEGFRNGTSELSLSLGAAFGLGTYIGHLNHDFVAASIGYGRMLGGVLGGSHWYRGNLEILGELSFAEQYGPKDDYLVMLTAPLLRYDFATGTRWSPFVEAGFGPSATDIGNPDLSTPFEFNIQGGVGLHYFWNQHQTIMAQCRFLHLSNAGFGQPNQGVNSCLFLIGTSRFF